MDASEHLTVLDCQIAMVDHGLLQRTVILQAYLLLSHGGANRKHEKLVLEEAAVRLHLSTSKAQQFSVTLGMCTSS